jgi:L-arabinokinase
MSQHEIISGSTHGLSDTGGFIDSLDRLVASLPNDWRSLFKSERELIVTRAPGRLDVMGGIADYSGSLVLQLPIQAAVHVALQRNESRRLRIASLPDASGSPARLFEMELAEIRQFRDYESARARFTADFESHWAAYVAGALLVLSLERNCEFDDGISILIKSAVPKERVSVPRLRSKSRPCRRWPQRMNLRSARENWRCYVSRWKTWSWERRVV